MNVDRLSMPIHVLSWRSRGLSFGIHMQSAGSDTYVFDSVLVREKGSQSQDRRVVDKLCVAGMMLLWLAHAMPE